MPDRRQLLVLAVLAVVVAGLGLRLLGVGDRPRAAGSEPAAQVPSVRVERTAARVTVHVAGAVRRPGLYRLRAGSRVDDAVQRAGGPLRGADLDALNLAAEVEDGRQVLVPERAARVGAAPAARTGAGAGAPAAGAAGAAGPVVNLNTATPEELDTLDGIGPALAAAIIAHREEHGGFASVAELAEVPGIGDARMAALEGRVGV